MRRILALLLPLLGAGAGLGAGLVLRPHDPETPLPEAKAAPETQPDYVKLANQFVVPIVEGGRVASMVILSLSLEVKAGRSDAVYAREPKIRDVFLQVLFDHANTGGFRGSFTDGSNLILLRRALTESAVGILGQDVQDVLITEIARQDS